MTRNSALEEGKVSCASPLVEVLILNFLLLSLTASLCANRAVF